MCYTDIPRTLLKGCASSTMNEDMATETSLSNLKWISLHAKLNTEILALQSTVAKVSTMTSMEHVAGLCTATLFSRTVFGISLGFDL